MNQNPTIYALNNELLLIKSLAEWRKKPEKRLRVIFKENYKQAYPDETSYNSKELLDTATKITITNLLMQSFTCSYEFLRNNIDDKMPAKLKNLRNQYSANTSNLNTVKFLDTIRQAFAHNDIAMENPNWQFNENFDIEISFRGHNFVFKFDELRILMNEFLLLKKEHFTKEFDVHETKLLKALEQNKLTPKNVNSFIVENNNKTITLFDQYQKEALFNLFVPSNDALENNIRVKKLFNNNYYILTHLLPIKQHAGMLSNRNNMCLRLLIPLSCPMEHRNYWAPAAKHLEKICNPIDSPGFDDSYERGCLAEFMINDSNLIEIYLLSNALFNIFSLTTASILEPYLNETGVNINRLRNSIMHGRYFYNNKDGFNFYDGRNNNALEYIGSISTRQISHALKSFVEDTYTLSV